MQGLDINMTAKKSDGREATFGFAILPSYPDDFADHQTEAARIAELGEDEQNQWLDSLTPAAGRQLLERLQSVQREHRRRATAAETLEDLVRGRFNVTAQHLNEESSAPTRG